MGIPFQRPRCYSNDYLKLDFEEDVLASDELMLLKSHGAGQLKQLHSISKCLQTAKK